MKENSKIVSWTLGVMLCSTAIADSVTLKDGGQLSGKIQGGTMREIRIVSGDGERAIPLTQIQSIAFDAAVAAPIPVTALAHREIPAAPTLPSNPAPPPLTLPTGMGIAIRTIDPIDSQGADLNRNYAASLGDSLVLGGVMVAPRGAVAVLRVTQAKQAGAVSGRASLTLKLVGITVNGKMIGVETGETVKQSGSQGAKTATHGVIGGVAGAAIGGVFGGGKGAGIGAGAGGAVGVATAALSGQRVKVPPETVLMFTLTQAAVVN